MEALASQHGLAMTVEPPDPIDIPPTKLDNPGPLRGGEAAVSFYVTPEYRSWDPSAVVFFSFAVFFGMIMSDAGYGLVLAVLLAAFWRRLSASEGRRRAALVVCGIGGRVDRVRGHGRKLLRTAARPGLSLVLVPGSGP